MGWTIRSLAAHPGWLAWTFTSVAYVYLASYTLMMGPRGPVVDSANGNLIFCSFYRFAPTVQLGKPPPTIFLPTVAWPNRLFRPVDAICDAILAGDAHFVRRDPTLFSFCLVLLAPLWVPNALLPGRGKPSFLRRMPCLIAIVWFLALILLWEWGGYVCAAVANRSLVKVGTVAGTLAAAASLVYAVRGWRHIYSAPLWIAILAGTVSLVLAF